MKFEYRSIVALVLCLGLGCSSCPDVSASVRPNLTAALSTSTDPLVEPADESVKPPEITEAQIRDGIVGFGKGFESVGIRYLISHGKACGYTSQEKQTLRKWAERRADVTARQLGFVKDGLEVRVIPANTVSFVFQCDNGNIQVTEYSSLQNYANVKDAPHILRTPRTRGDVFLGSNHGKHLPGYLYEFVGDPA